MFFDAVDKLIRETEIYADIKQIKLKEEYLDDIVRRAQDEAKLIGYPRPLSDELLKKLIADTFK